MGRKHLFGSLIVATSVAAKVRGEEKIFMAPEEIFGSSLASMARDVLSMKTPEGKKDSCEDPCPPDCHPPPDECEPPKCNFLNVQRFLHLFQCSLLKRSRGMRTMGRKDCVEKPHPPCKHRIQCPLFRGDSEECPDECPENSGGWSGCEGFAAKGGFEGMILPFMDDSKDTEGMQVQELDVKTPEGSFYSDTRSSVDCKPPHKPPPGRPPNCNPRQKPHDAVCQQGFYYPQSPGQVLTSTSINTMDECEAFCSNNASGTEAYAFSFGGLSGPYARTCICYSFSPFGTPKVDYTNESGTGPVRQCGHAIVDCGAAFYVGYSRSKYGCRVACDYYMRLHNQSNYIMSYVSANDEGLTENCYCYWRIPKNAKVIDCNRCYTRPRTMCSAVIPRPCNPCPCPCPPCGIATSS